MDKANSLPTPIVSNIQLSKDKGEPIENERQYRSIVGALQYVTITRPDITYSINKVSQYMHKPLSDHWMAVKRILRYLKGTINLCLSMKRSKILSLTGYADSDWGNDRDDRKSTSGYCIFIGRCPISWCAKKQSTVSRSSTEAEYRSIASASAELIWIQSLLSELKIEINGKPTIWCDNLSAIAITANPVLHSRTKHMELDIYFVREHLMKNKVQINHIPSTYQVADILTKPLSKQSFIKPRENLGISELKHGSENNNDKTTSDLLNADEYRRNHQREDSKNSGIGELKHRSESNNDKITSDLLNADEYRRNHQLEDIKSSNPSLEK